MSLPLEGADRGVSPQNQFLRQMAEVIDRGMDLTAQQHQLESAFTDVGRELLDLRNKLEGGGISVTFNLSPEIMAGIERASNEPHTKVADVPSAGMAVR